jgi:putative peptidoglycan lipid II flippase
MAKLRTSAQIAMIVAILTLLSKIIGFVKNMFLAGYFGTSYIVDTLNISNAIPSMIFAGVLGATATSFIPSFSKIQENEGALKANLFTSRLINLLVIISIVSSLVGILLSKQVVTLFTMPDVHAAAGSNILEKAGWYLTHGWTGERLALASFYVKVTFSYCLFGSAAGILDSYLKYKNVFIAPVISGYLVNFCIIIFIITSNIFSDPRLLVFGVFAGTIINCIVICILAARKHFHYTFDFHMGGAVKNILVLAVPVFIGSTIGQINMFVDRTLASGLPEGSIASLDYANLLIALSTGLTSSIIGTILYPKMAQAYALDDRERFSNIFSTGLFVIIILGVPLTLGSLLYNGALVHIVYLRGAFDMASLSMTSTAFFYYSIGMLPQMVGGFLVALFYSKHDTRTPLYVGFVSVIFNIVFSLILIRPLAHGGLALGTSIAATVSAVIMLIIIWRKSTGIITRGFAIKCIKVGVAAVIAVGASAPVFRYLPELFLSRGWIYPHMVQLGLAVLVAAGVYLLLLKLLKIEELKHLRTMLKFS